MVSSVAVVFGPSSDSRQLADKKSPGDTDRSVS